MVVERQLLLLDFESDQECENSSFACVSIIYLSIHSHIQPFIHSFNKYLLSASHVPEIVGI